MSVKKIVYIVSFFVLTRRKRLLKLVGLGLVLDNKSVEVARASNLELDRVSVLLDASGYTCKKKYLV